MTRRFCTDCGTQLTYVHADEPGTIDVTAASLDEPGGVGPEDHVWCDRMLPWIDPGDDLPRYGLGKYDGGTVTLPQYRVSEAFFVFYVRDQTRSAAFYRDVLERDPILDVPGMTEFRLRHGSILGLLPVASAKRLLGASTFPSATEVPRAELYLVVGDAASYHRRALASGGTELSPMSLRDWGQRAAYSADLDGHVLAFAERSELRAS